MVEKSFIIYLAVSTEYWRVVTDRQTSNLDQDTVDAPSLNSFKNRLNKIRSTRMGFFMD